MTNRLLGLGFATLLFFGLMAAMGAYSYGHSVGLLDGYRIGLSVCDAR